MQLGFWWLFRLLHDGSMLPWWWVPKGEGHDSKSQYVNRFKYNYDTDIFTDTRTATKPSTAMTSPSRVSEASFVKLPMPTTVSPQPTTTSALRTGTAGATLPTAYVTLDRVPSATSSHTPDSTPNSLPVVAIVGIAVGGAVLVGLAVLLLICRRHRKQKNIYQAPIYVSPFNTSSDMSQKGDGIYKANLWGPSFNTHDLKKQDSGTHGGATASSPRLVELPGESGTGTH
jgi:hypothetical protein